MWNSIKVQLKIMRISREFRVALLISSLYAVYAFVYYALEARKEDIFHVLDASEYVCFSPNNGLWNMYLMVYPFLVVMPFATSYISDYKNRLMVIYASRVSRRNYYLSKLVASFIGSALVVAIPFLLNLLLCNIFFPHNLNYWSIYPMRSYYGNLLGLTFAYEHISSQIPFLGVLLSSPVLYGVLYIFLFSFISGLLGMLAMAISFVVKRFKIILYIPIYVLIQILSNMDMVVLNAAIDGKETYVSYNFLDYFIPYNNWGGFSLLVILAELGAVLLVIALCLYYAIHDDIRSVQ